MVLVLFPHPVSTPSMTYFRVCVLWHVSVGRNQQTNVFPMPHERTMCKCTFCLDVNLPIHYPSRIAASLGGIALGCLPGSPWTQTQSLQEALLGGFRDPPGPAGVSVRPGFADLDFIRNFRPQPPVIRISWASQFRRNVQKLHE